MTIKVLRQKRADLVAEAQKMFDTAAAENRGLTDAEATRDDAITAELSALDGQIARAERQMERQRALGTVVDDNDAADRAGAAAQRGGNPKAFKTFGEQMMAVARAAGPDARVDPRLISAGPTGLSEGVGSDGGFLVQTDFQAQLIENIFESGEIASRVDTIPIGANSNGIHMNGVDETSRANGSRWGGIRAYWTGEAALLTASQPKFRKIKMELDKLTGLCYATDELMQDAVALDAWLRKAFNAEFTFKVEDAVINGTGAGMPLGILNSGAVITVAKEGSQAAATVVAENILKMYARMPAARLKNAVWLINQDVQPQLWQLNVKIKNVAGTENVGGIAVPPMVSYIPPGTLPGQKYGLLMGLPVVPVEYCATLGTSGDIVLADLSQYLVIDKGGVDAQTSIHVRFIYDELTFRFIYRANGMPLQAAPVTPYKGSNTLSPFIALQTR